MYSEDTMTHLLSYSQEQKIAFLAIAEVSEESGRGSLFVAAIRIHLRLFLAGSSSRRHYLSIHE